ncbi:MAG TPA: hypothetical protein VFM74_02595, partial [Candidatus Limnocylindria bacterium]|nr:hypothetical protein [Candidatus Limnocylindria bacterium]
MAEGGAAVRLLRPVRVLVAGHDAFLVDGLCHDLLRLGFQAMATTRAERVAKLAAIERVNVVIIEPSGGLAAAASLAGALDELPHRVRVLFACEPGSSAERLGYDTVDPEASPAQL